MTIEGFRLIMRREVLCGTVAGVPLAGVMCWTHPLEFGDNVLMTVIVALETPVHLLVIVSATLQTQSCRTMHASLRRAKRHCIYLLALRAEFFCHKISLSPEVCHSLYFTAPSP